MLSHFLLVPVLLQILSGAQSAQDLLPPGVVYTLEPNKVVEVVMPAGVIGGPVSSILLLAEPRSDAIFAASVPLARRK